MAKFFLDAELRLGLPKNVATTLNSLKSQLKGFTVPININTTSTNAALNTVNKNLSQTKKAAQSAKNEMEALGAEAARSLRRFTIFSVATIGVYKFAAALQSSVSDALDFSKEMTKLQQVTGESQKRLSGISDEVTRLAIKFGYSSTKILDVAVTLSQAGLSAKDTKIALEALTKTGVAATFGTIKETTEAAIAIMNQFGKEAKDLDGILGSVNRVAADFAVEAEDIGVAVRRAGSTFAAAGGNFHEFQALFTSVRQTTRASAESIATGLRTIEARLQRPRTQNFLRSLGIDLVDAEGQFVGLYKSVELLNHSLSGLKRTDPRFAQIAEELGGYRQLDKIIPLIEKFDVTQKAYNTSLKGGNSLIEDAAIHQKSLAFQLTTVNEQFQSLIRKMTGDAPFKAMVTSTLALASAFIKLVDSVRPFIPMIAALGAFKFLNNFQSLKGGFANKILQPSKFADGGKVKGQGSGDTVPAMLEPGEWVLTKKEVQAIGPNGLKAFKKQAQYFSDGSNEPVKKRRQIGVQGDFKAKSLLQPLAPIQPKNKQELADELDAKRLEKFYTRIAAAREKVSKFGSRIGKKETVESNEHPIMKAMREDMAKLDRESRSAEAQKVSDLGGDEANEYATKKKRGSYNTTKKTRALTATEIEVQDNKNFKELAKALSPIKVEKKLDTLVTEVKQNTNEEKKPSSRKSKKKVEVSDGETGLIIHPKYGRKSTDASDREMFIQRRFGVGPSVNPPTNSVVYLSSNAKSPNTGIIRGPTGLSKIKTENNTQDYIDAEYTHVPPMKRIGQNGPIIKYPHRARIDNVAGYLEDFGSPARYSKVRFHGGPQPTGNQLGGFSGQSTSGPLTDRPVPFGPPKPYRKSRKNKSGGLEAALQNPALIAGIILTASELTQQTEHASDAMKNIAKIVTSLTTKLIALGTGILVFKELGKMLDLKGAGKSFSSSGVSGFATNFLDRNQTGYSRGIEAKEIRRLRNSGFSNSAINSQTFVNNRRRMGRNAQLRQAGGVLLAAGGAVYGEHLATQGDKDIQNGSTNGNKSTGGRILAGVSTGVAIGSYGGVKGALIGAAAGGALAYVLDDTAHKIKEVQIDKSLNEFAHKLKRFSEGKIGTQTLSSTFSNTLLAKKGEYLSSDSEHQQQIKAGINQNSSGIQDFFNAIAKTSKNFADFNKSTQGTLEFFAQLSDVPYHEMKEQIEETIRVSKIHIGNVNKVNIALDEQNARLEIFDTLITGLNNLEPVVAKFEHSLDTLNSFINFTATSFKQIDFGEIFKNAEVGQVGVAQFSKASNKLGSNFGVQGQELSNAAIEALNIAKELPRLLIETRKEDPLGRGQNFTSRLLDKFDKMGISGVARNSLEAATGSVIGNEGSEQGILDKIRFNVVDLAKELTKDTSIAIEEMGKLEPHIKKQVERISKSFELYNQAQEKITELSIKQADKYSEVEDMINDVVNNGRNLPLSHLQARESHQAIKIGGSNNVNILASNLKDAQEAVKHFDELLSENSLNVEESTKLLAARSVADKNAVNAAKALHFLAFEAKNLANIQKQISEEQKVALHKQSVAEQLVFGGRDENKRLSETLTLVAKARIDGIENVPQNRRADVGNLLKEGLPQEHKRVFREGLINKGFSDEQADRLVRGTNPEIEQLIEQLKMAGLQQQQAMEALKVNNELQGQTLLSSLTEANGKFLGDLKAIMDESVRKGDVRALENTKGSIKEVEDKLGTVSGLKKKFGVGGLGKNDISDVGGYSGLLEERRNILGKMITTNRNEESYKNNNKYWSGAKLSDFQNKKNEIENELKTNTGRLEESPFSAFTEEAKKSGLLNNAEELSKTIKQVNKSFLELKDTDEALLYKERERLRNQQSEIEDRLTRAGGGTVPGFGVGDKVPAMLTPGEFVIKKSSANRLGKRRLNQLNDGVQKFADGGLVDSIYAMYGEGGTNPNPKRLQKELDLYNRNKVNDAKSQAKDSLSSQKLASATSQSNSNIATQNSRGDTESMRKIKQDLFSKGLSIGRGSGGARLKRSNPENDPNYEAEQREQFNDRKTNADKKFGVNTEKIERSKLERQVKFDNQQTEARSANDKNSTIYSNLKDNLPQAELDANRKKFLEGKKNKTTAQKSIEQTAVQQNSFVGGQVVKKNNQNIKNKENGVGGQTNSNSGFSAADISKFNEAIKTFSTDSKALTEALNNKKLEVTMNGKVEVILNGGEIISKIQGQFKEEVGKQILQAVSDYHEKNWKKDGKEMVS